MKRSMLVQVHEWLSKPAYPQISDHARDWYATIDDYESVLEESGFEYADDDCWLRTDSQGTWTATTKLGGTLYLA